MDFITLLSLDAKSNDIISKVDLNPVRVELDHKLLFVSKPIFKEGFIVEGFHGFLQKLTEWILSTEARESTSEHTPNANLSY